MFEQFESLLSKRNYSDAGQILSVLGAMVGAKHDRAPTGFYDAQVRVVPMDACIHIFVLLTNKEAFWQLPGDRVISTQENGHTVISKQVTLSDLFSPDCRTPMRLHFLYTCETNSEVIAA